MSASTKTDAAMTAYFKTRGYVPGGIITNSRREQLNIAALPPFLRTLLVTDGTVTKSLEAYFWEPVVVENLKQHKVALTENIPWLELKKGASVLAREVLLRGQDSNAIYAYAKSILNLSRLPTSLCDDLLAGKIGIGELLRERGLETYREILDVGSESHEVASDKKQFDEPMPDELRSGELLYRSYRVVINHEPTILITEKFPQHRYLKS